MSGDVIDARIVELGGLVVVEVLGGIETCQRATSIAARRMPRRPRLGPAGVRFHVLNRAIARLPLFEKPEDYDAFQR
ncbi:MAG: hypothetical protein OES79_06180 [Planctomycetota bacterium]|nr:hypothetical protein [Planctomycetota bacterium]